MDGRSQILIVDDDTRFLHLVREEFAEAEFELVLFSDPQKALDSFDEDIELAILDIKMPEMDGFELCESIRKMSEGLPILMLTGIEDFEAIEKAYQAGATDFIYKPNNWPWQLLPYRVRYMLKAKRALQDAYLKEAAVLASKAKSDFLTKMSHELKTPLSGIIGFSNLLRYEVEDPKHRDWLDKILNTCDYLTDLINDVLNLAQIEAGYIELDCKSVDIVALIENAIYLISHLAQERDIEIHFQPEEKNFLFYTDPMRFQQVLFNLLSNAVKYNKSSGTIDILLERDADFLRFEVKDSGIGMTAEQLSKLFEPFNRFGHGKNIEGTGIGLSIVKKLVDTMAGEISCRSQVKVGSVFSVKLPHMKVAD